MNAIFQIIRPWFLCRLWACPHALADTTFPMRDVLSVRAMSKLKVLDPGFPRDDPSDQPPGTPSPSFPTDVPAPEPHDVPAPEPVDPPPDPGGDPTPTKPPERPKQDPKPRPIP